MNLSMAELLQIASRLPPAQRAKVLAQVNRQTLAPPKRRSKYGNVKVVVDGVRFDSKKEAARYTTLKLLKQAGEVLWFAIQPQFVLEGGVVYRADFVVAWKGGRVGVEDVKSVATSRDKSYRIKRRQVEARYGFKIEEL